MKKLLTLILLVTVCISYFSEYANAATISNNNLYILSASCPNDAVNYAKEIFDNLPKDKLTIGTKVELGSPFVLVNNKENMTLYYFPVILKNEVIYTYRIYNLNGWKHVLSKVLVNELNQARTNSTKISPTLVYIDNNNNIIVQNKKHTFILEDNSITSKTKNIKNNISPYDDILNDFVDSSLYSVINCDLAIKHQTVNFNNNIKTKIASSNYDSYCAHYISPTINETQVYSSWCAGYVIAFIVSFQTDTPYYAREVAAYSGVDNTDDSIPVYKCVNFAQSKGLNNTRRTIFDVSDIGMMEQIDAGHPVFVGSYSGLNGHAFAVCGFCWSGTEIVNWYIWNPWYNYFEYIDSSRTYITPAGTILGAWETFIVDIY